MKRIFLFLLIIISQSMIAKDINPDIKPEALSDIDFPFPKYEVEKLKNGLKVYYLPESEIIHYHGVSFKKATPDDKTRWKRLNRTM